MVWVRQVTNFSIKWCVEVENVGPKLIPTEGTSISCDYVW